MRYLLCFLAMVLWGQGAMARCVTGAAGISKACFAQPAARGYYGHNILGNTPEWTELTVKYSSQAVDALVDKRRSATIALPHNIFEDIAPRLADMDGDGFDDVIVVETNTDQGARLAIYRFVPRVELLAATPYIGRPYRWLAPVGVADFNRDGHMDVAYVDRPHLAKTLRVWSFLQGGLREIAQMKSLTNHRIGDDFITGGVRNCAGHAEVIVVDSAWRKVVAISMTGGKLRRKTLRNFSGPASIKRALSCQTR